MIENKQISNEQMLNNIVENAKDLKVLYVEDHEDTRASTLLFLKEFFSQIIVAIDGYDGLKKYEKDNFDLVISDVNMPNMGGIQMSRAILKMNIEQPIIIISAHNESRMLVELINIGVEYFVQKPFDFKNFTQVLAKSTKRINDTKEHKNNIKKIEQLNIENKNLIKNFDKYVVASRTDKRGIITYASEAFCKIAGYKETELIGKPHNMVRHSDMPKETFRELWSTIKAGNTWKGEVKNLKKDGGIYWVRATISPSYDQETNELLGYNAIREDITYQKEVMELSKKIKLQSQRMSDLLNNAGEGFLSFDVDLIIEETLSKESLNLLGDDIAGKNIAKLLYANDNQKRELFENIIDNIHLAKDDLSKEMFLSLLEKELCMGNVILELEYKLLKDSRFMLIIKNITDKKNLARKLEAEKKIQKMVVAVVSNYPEFSELIFEYQNFIKQIDTYDFIQLKREIHTFKGLFAQKEMIHLTHGLHDVETQMNNSSIQNRPNISLLENWLNKDMQILKKVLGDDFLKKKNRISIDSQTLTHIEQKVISLSKHFKEKDKDFDDLLCQVMGLRDSSLKDLLSGFPILAQNIAQKLDKPIYGFEIQGDKSIKVSQTHKPFIKSLVHVFRNSIDHGIESLDERIKLGKDEMGSITCQFYQNKNELTIKISDDGGGIDIDTLKSKIIEKGVLNTQAVDKLSKKDQLKLIFADNISTKDCVTKLSGRGVGLGAVKAELDKINGSLEVESQKNRGTIFTFKSLIKEYGETYERV